MTKTKKNRFEQQAQEYRYPIVTQYAWGRDILKTNRGLDPAMAVARAIVHMQSNRYQARGCYIFDERTNTPIAAIWRSVTRGITVKYYDESVCLPLIKVGGELAKDDKEGKFDLPEDMSFMKAPKHMEHFGSSAVH